MKHFLNVTLMLISLISCNKNENKEPDEASKKAVTVVDNHKTEIEKLVKTMYQWVEKPNAHGWKLIKKDTLIVGYDLEDHKLYLKELEHTGIFAKEFIQNIDKIVRFQNEKFRTGEAKWTGEDMGPFDGDTNQWCNCQDEPSADPYNKITLHFYKIDTTSAAFYWNWEGFGTEIAAMHYAMRAIKENGKWKIAWMEGWDYDENTRF